MGAPEPITDISRFSLSNSPGQNPKSCYCQDMAKTALIEDIDEETITRLTEWYELQYGRWTDGPPNESTVLHEEWHGSKYGYA